MRGTTVKSAHHDKRTEVKVRCSLCNCELKVFLVLDNKSGKSTFFQNCNLCKTKRPFVHNLERSYHMLQKPGKEVGSRINRCKFCKHNDRGYDIEEAALHRQEIHGFCTEHYICSMKNCFYVCSNPSDYDSHVLTCTDQPTA